MKIALPGRVRSVLGVVAVLSLVPALVYAEEPETESYGWTTAAVDGVAVGLAGMAFFVGIPCRRSATPRPR